MQMQYTKSIDNKSILGIIRRFCGYIDPRLTEHGAHVAYIIFRMLQCTSEYTEQECRDISYVAQFHDVGAYKTEEMARIVKFETEDIWEHSFYGYLFIRYFSPLKDLAPAIFLHHIRWELLEDEAALTPKLKDLSQLINVADTIDVSMTLRKWSWQETLAYLNDGRGTYYAPHIVDLAAQLDFSESVDLEWKRDLGYFDFLTRTPLSNEDITDYLKMLVFIIDFRSHHTVTHTMSTISISYELGKLLNLNEDQLNHILCGSLLHDLGKIAIPVEILEYPGKLSYQAMTIMKTHVNLTEEIFGGSIDETIQRISLRHHEKLDGSGYPRGLTAYDLTTEERLVAIADIISALTGTRSYKDSFPEDRIISILTKMKKDYLLDPVIIDIACENLTKILETTIQRCQPVLSIYERLNTEYEHLLGLEEFTDKLQFVLSLKKQEDAFIWP